MAKELNYHTIKEILGDDVFGAAIGEDGLHIILGYDKIDDEEVYTASWLSKVTEQGEWWVTHVYHEDGTCEEMYEFN